MDDRNERGGHASGAPRIEVQCLSCGRLGCFETDDSRIRGAPLVQLTRRFRCSACGSRAIKATNVRTPRDIAKLLRARMQSGRS